jgi:Flp pilus assembly protein TadB
MRPNGRLADRGQGHGAAERELAQMALPEGEVIDIVAFGLLFAATAALASRSRRLLDFNAEEQCTPSCSAAGLRPWPVRICQRTLPKRQREHPARRIEVVWIIFCSIIYLILVVTLGVMSIRKGHWIMFIIGFFLPFFWLIGALMPARRPAY